MKSRLISIFHIGVLMCFCVALHAQNQRQELKVPAGVMWVDTGITISAGDNLQVSASGQWSNGGGTIRFVGPDGFRGLRVAGALLPSASLASLIGRIGSSLFIVGSDYSGRSSLSGEFFLSMNDLPNTFWDNKGALQVVINVGKAPDLSLRNSQPTTDLCRTPEIRAAMQIVVDRETQDPGGALLGLAACGITGVCANPAKMQPTILQSRPSSDGGGYTANDPGSFLCQGLFARGNVHLEVNREGDLASELTKAEMDRVLQTFPNFVENFKIRPLQSRRYLLILLPAITGLSNREYSTQFSYPQ